MRCWDYPVAPMIVGLILDRWLKVNFVARCKLAGATNWSFQHPSSAILLALAAIALAAPLVFKGLKKFKGEDA